MKAKYIIASLVAVCALAIGCTKDAPTVLDEVQVSSSYIGLANNEGANSKTITVTAKESWSINDIPEWLTIQPTSGAVGETTVTFSADKASATRQVNIKLACAGKEQTIIVKQEAEKVTPPTLTIAEALKVIEQYPDGSPVQRVKGVVCKIQEISPSYGNATFYLSEDGKFEDGKWLQVYRGLWMNGAAFTKGDEFALGDELTIEGVLMSYKGTPETKEKEAYVIEINKSLIKCDSLVYEGVKLETLPIEGGSFDAVLTCKGNGVSVVIPNDAKSWLSVTGIKTEGTKATVSFLAAKNEGGDRTTELTFSTTDGTKDYTASASVAQLGSIMDVTIAEYLAAAEDNTQYRISGIITKVAQDSEKYGANLYIKDATGEVYIYGTTDETGTVKTLASFGAKEGDIVEFVGKRSSYNGTPQMAKGVFQWFKAVTPVTAAEVANLSDDDKNDPKNYIKLTGTVANGSTISGHKFDLNTYGNFDLLDETGSVYVYGVSTGWKGQTKQFGTLGVKEGDIITIVAYKTSYNGLVEAVGMYVSHEEGKPADEGDDEGGDDGQTTDNPYSIDLTYNLVKNAYDDVAAKVNGTEGVKTIKIGTSKAAGEFTVTVPAGTKNVSFYAVGWNATPATVEFYVGENKVAEQAVAANSGAAGNGPYELTITDSDKYTLAGDFSAETIVKVTAATRVVFFGIKAEK